MNKRVRLSYMPSEGLYLVRSGDDQLYICQKERGYRYIDGIEQCARKIAGSYFLWKIDFKDGDTVIDCGANIGELFVFFQMEKKMVEYIGIEPSPVEYGCLVKNVAGHELHNIGLWNCDSELKFYISSKGADSSIIEPSSYEDIISIKTKRLDSIINKRVKLLKIEAEGAEPEVLAGCEGILADIEYIAADLSYERGVKKESTLVPVINYLLERNFELLKVSHHRIVALFKNKSFN